ncbi:MAG: Rieske 2Fe-2S domain-containing protein [Telmatospirillum sp.]|nr:Rieske 2Fe-2S domain-containing protein [Telmatospirillum sp.]
MDRLSVVCALDEIPSRRAVGIVLARLEDDGREVPWPVVLVRWGRRVIGYHNRCPHGGVPLDWERGQFLDPHYGTRLMCGKHGALFNLADGLCVDGPCRGERLEPVPLAVVDGDVCVVGVPLARDEEVPG